MRTYAQNYEDVILNRFFRGKKNGFYIDVGAHDPDDISVTKLFYEKGWSGINIEPTKSSFKRFKEVRKRDINLQIGIAARRGKRLFYEVEGELHSGDSVSALSTFLKDVADSTCKKFDLSYKKYTVKTDSLANVCKQYVPKDTVIDFLKIDTEGYEKVVLKSGDFEKYRPTVIVVEATKPNSYPFETTNPEDQGTWEAFEDIILAAGYENVYFDGLNRFYLANGAANKQLFGVPVGIFDGIDYRSLEKEVDNHRRAARSELKDLRLSHKELEEEVQANKVRLEKEKARHAETMAALQKMQRIMETIALSLKANQEQIKLVTKEKSKILECLLREQANQQGYQEELYTLKGQSDKQIKEMASLRNENASLLEALNNVTLQYNTIRNKFIPLQRTYDLTKAALEESDFKKRYWLQELIEKMVPFGLLTKKQNLQVASTVVDFSPDLPRLGGEQSLPLYGFAMACQCPTALGHAWTQIQEALNAIQSENAKVFLVPSLEHFMAGNNGHRQAITTDWVGFVHTPTPLADHVGLIKKAVTSFAPIDFDNVAWKKSEAHCRALFVASEYHAKQIREQCNVPVHVARPALPTDLNLWDVSTFSKNACKTIIQADEPLSRYFGVHLLTLDDFEKIVWTNIDIHSGEYIRNEEKYLESRGLFKHLKDSASVAQSPSREERAQLLASSIIFLHLYAPIVPSILFDCIASGTPILINPQPSVVELLGADYPLYFNHYQEASRKAQDMELLVRTSQHLRGISGRADLRRGCIDQVVKVIDELE